MTNPHNAPKHLLFCLFFAFLLASCGPSSTNELVRLTSTPIASLPPDPAFHPTEVISTLVNLDTPTPYPTTNPDLKFKTSIGDLAIDAVRWVDEANGVKPGSNEKLLLIMIRKPDHEKLDPGNFSLEDFDKALRNQANGEVHVAGDDGSYAICTMAGWVGKNYEDFALGFRIPKTARTLQLYWPGNEPIELLPEE